MIGRLSKLKLSERLEILQNRTWRLFFIALAFGVAAGIGSLIYLKVIEYRLEARLKPQKQAETAVIVANQDLAVGDKVSANTMAVRTVPTAYVAPEYVSPDMFGRVDGAVMVRKLPKGRMLTWDLLDLNIPKDFSDTIKEGHLAITISVDELNAISGLIRPGNYVDIYTRLPAPAAGTEAEQGGDLIIPVLDRVMVLATGKKAARPNQDEFDNLSEIQRAKSYGTITLELPPEKAGILAVAREEGDLITVLRNEKDNTGTPFSTIDRSDLFANSKKMQEENRKKELARLLDRVRKTADGRLVTMDGVFVTDPNVMMNEAGLIVNKDGVILSGRGLLVNSQGQIVDKHGRVVDTANLVAGEDGTLIDSNGNVLAGNGYETLKGGFVKDANGRIMTADGKVLDGVTVDENGNVVTASGRRLDAKELKINEDGSVSIANAHRLSLNENGEVVDETGAVVDLDQVLVVDAEGNVRTKNGALIPGVRKGADGKYYDEDGNELSLEELIDRYNEAEAGALDGITAAQAEDFAGAIKSAAGDDDELSRLTREVEYILGGGSRGTATTVMVPVEDRGDGAGAEPAVTETTQPAN